MSNIVASEAVPSTSASVMKQAMRTTTVPRCHMCGSFGSLLYAGLEDRYFGVGGKWNLKVCPRHECGLVWSDPMPIEQDIGKAYEAYYTHGASLSDSTKKAGLSHFIKTGYLARRYGYRASEIGLIEKIAGLGAYLVPLHRAKADFLRMYLPCVPDGHLLEIGCGSGGMLLMMRELGWQVQGIDLDPLAVANCQRNGIEAYVGKLEDFAYAENKFDAVTMSHVLEHVHKPLDLLRECRRVLKVGGRLSLVTPNLKSLGHALYRAAWFHLDPPRHLHLFTPLSLQALLVESGFTKIKIFTTIRDANMVFIASHSIAKLGIYKWGSRGLLALRMWGRIMHLIECALVNVAPHSGEELVAIIEK